MAGRTPSPSEEEVAAMINGLRQTMLQIAEVMDTVCAAVIGYRAKYVAHGLELSACDEIAVEYHRFLMNQIRDAQKEET